MKRDLTCTVATALPAAREHRWFLSLVVGYVAAVAALSCLLGRPMLVDLPTAAIRLWGISALLAAIALILGLFFRRRRIEMDGRAQGVLPAYRLAWTEFRKERLTRVNTWSTIVPLLLGPALLSGFSTAKQMINVLHPFAFDVVFDQWDLRLHGGVRPYQWIQPLFTPALTNALTVWYHTSWGLVVTSTFVAASLKRNGAIRRRYLISLALTYAMLGTVAATALSSAGPAYYHLATGAPNPYAPLLEYLRSSGSAVVYGHENVWASLSSGPVLGAGVSAMPSMHVANMMHSAIFWGAIDKRTWAIGAPLVLITLIGSVHLGWHYAIDGYVGIAGVLVLWWVAGRLARQ